MTGAGLNRTSQSYRGHDSSVLKADTPLGTNPEPRANESCTVHQDTQPSAENDTRGRTRDSAVRQVLAWGCLAVAYVTLFVTLTSGRPWVAIPAAVAVMLGLLVLPPYRGPEGEW